MGLELSKLLSLNSSFQLRDFAVLRGRSKALFLKAQSVICDWLIRRLRITLSQTVSPQSHIPCYTSQLRPRSTPT